MNIAKVFLGRLQEDKKRPCYKVLSQDGCLPLSTGSRYLSGPGMGPARKKIWVVKLGPIIKVPLALSQQMLLLVPRGLKPVSYEALAPQWWSSFLSCLVLVAIMFTLITTCNFAVF